MASSAVARSCFPADDDGEVPVLWPAGEVSPGAWILLVLLCPAVDGEASFMSLLLFS